MNQNVMNVECAAITNTLNFKAIATRCVESLRQIRWPKLLFKTESGRTLLNDQQERIVPQVSFLAK
jgi:hypothetical protein